jgi:hypothetical protein
MRSLIIAGLAATLAACAVSQDAATSAVKADALAWQGFDAASVSLDGLAKSGVIHGPVAKVIACDLDKTKSALLAADSAYGAGDSLSANQNAAAASTLIVELTTIAAAAKTGLPITTTAASAACAAQGA